MLQNGIDDLLILDGADDPHGSPTFRTNQWIDLINFLNQPGPAFPARRRGSVGFDDVRDGVVFQFFIMMKKILDSILWGGVKYLSDCKMSDKIVQCLARCTKWNL